MRKYFAIAAFFCIVTGLLFSIYACKESHKQVDLSKPNYSPIDTLLGNSIDSVDWRSVYYGSDEQRELIVTRLNQIVDSLEQTGDLNELGAETYRGIIYNCAYMRLEAEEWFSRAFAHNSLEDRKQWYYNNAGYELANLLYIRHNYEGFLRVAVPLLASMDSLGTFLRIDHKIDLYSLLGCCYLKLEQPDKAKEAVMRARDFGRQVLAVDTSHYIHQSFINYYARIKDAYVNQMIGFWEDDPFYGETIDDIRGHQLLIYTDGLNEAENQQKELLGNERLLELMADAKSLDAHQVIDMLVEAVEQHRAGANPNDDLTLMCLKLSR